MLIIPKTIFFNLCILLLPTSFGSVNEDYYTLLGVEKNADLRQIRSAFKKLALVKHPDKNKNDPDAHSNFLKLAEAYDVLKDTTKRNQYDMYGKKGFENHSSPKYHSYTYYRDQFGIYDDDPHVVTLSNEDFRSSIGDNIWFVNFYSPLCSHCHLLANDWRALSRNLDGVVKIGAVNCEDERNLCWDLQIQQYPTLLFYNERALIYDGVAYTGIRNKVNMEKFIMEHLSDIITVPEVKSNFVLNETPWVIFIKPDQRSDMPNPEYNQIKLAAVLKGLVSVGYTNDEGLIKKLSVSDYSDVIFWKKNEDGTSQLHALTDDSNHLSLVEKVLDFLPNVRELTQDDFQNARTLLRSGLDTPLLLCFSLNSDNQKAIMLKKLSGTLESFRIGSIDCARNADLCRSLHIVRYPTWAILKKGGAFEIHSGRSSLHSIERFAIDAHEATNIHALSPQDLQRIMAEGSPWIIGWLLTGCPPCKRMLPALRKASNHFAPDTIQFGTVDCAQHSHVCSQYNVHSYPTTAIYNASTVSTFTGESSKESIIEFIEANKLNYVIKLNEDSFRKEIDEKPENILYAVEFYAPWCGPCQKLQPEWIKMAQKLSYLKKVKVGAVNCETHGNICSKEGIRSYPTIRLYPMGSKGKNSVVIYSNPNRDAVSIRNWVIQFFQTPLTNIDIGNFRKSLLSNREDRTWVVMFYAPWCGYCHQFEPEFLIAAERLKNIVVAGKVNCQKDGALCQQENISSYPTVKLYQRIDGVTNINSDIKIEARTQEDLFVKWRAYAAEAYITPVEHDEL